MARNRFVVPETVRLDLSDGDWIEVKRELTYGEQQQLSAAVTKQNGDLAQGESLRVALDLAAYNIERAAMWIVEWSFVGSNGQVVGVSRETLSALDGETGAEIDRTLTQHIAGIEARKNSTQPG